jgi:hypothetical protein
MRRSWKAFAGTAVLLCLPLAVSAQNENILIIDPSVPALPSPHFWE